MPERIPKTIARAWLVKREACSLDYFDAVAVDGKAEITEAAIRKMFRHCERVDVAWLVWNLIGHDAEREVWLECFAASGFKKSKYARLAFAEIQRRWVAQDKGEVAHA